MLVQISQHFRAPPAAVYAWCTDFQDSDPELSRVRLRTRHVLRREGAAVEMEETGVMVFPFRARFEVLLKPPDAWDAGGSSNMGRTRNTYQLTPDGGGTRLDLTLDVHLKGAYRMMMPFAPAYIRRKVAREWQEYAQAMESSLAGPGGSVGRG